MHPSPSRVASRWVQGSYPGETYREIAGDDWFVIGDVADDTKMTGWRVSEDGIATAESFEDEWDWLEPFERTFADDYSTDPSPKAQVQIDALTRTGRPLSEWNTVWHVTDTSAARNIMQGGFKAQPTPKGRGVSVSGSRRAAKGLLQTLQRMNSFGSHDQVVDWYRSRGVSEDDLAATLQAFQAKPPRYGSSPAALYLRMMSNFHPAVGGSARIPQNEFLWVDIGSHLVDKPIVAVEASYGGPLPTFGEGSIEAELFLRPEGLMRLAPERVVRSL